MDFLKHRTKIQGFMVFQKLNIQQLTVSIGMKLQAETVFNKLLFAPLCGFALLRPKSKALVY
jgi:hypothetical protein